MTTDTPHAPAPAAMAPPRAAARPDARAAMPRPALADLALDGAARRALLAILAGFALVRVWAMVAVPLTDTTEARYGEIARKMVETGNWLTPQYDYGVPFWGKPPLHTWLAAAGMRGLGITEAAARLPIALTALAVLGLVWLWVRDNAGRNSALAATVVLATMGLFFGASAFVMTDMPMALGTTLVMVGLWQAMTTGSRRWGYGVFVGLAVGMLAKGPVAVVICAIPVLGWLALTGRWRALGRLPWLRGTALAAVLVVPWYGAAEIATPGFLRYFLWGEHVQRFLTPGWAGDLYGTGHQQAKGMIWPSWLVAALPWSVAAALLLARPARLRAAVAGDGSGWLAYLALWAVAPMVLFTPASNILAAYVLPGLPATAVLIVVLWAQVHGPRPGARARIRFVAAAGLTGALFAALTAGMALAPQALRVKTDKALVAAAAAARPGAPLYTVGGRSYSAEFYTRGQARVLDAAGFARRATDAAPAAFSLTPAMAPEALAAGLVPLGAYGRHVLFVTPPVKEVP